MSHVPRTTAAVHDVGSHHIPKSGSPTMSSGTDETQTEADLPPEVLVIDTPEDRVRQPSDLLALLLALLGATLVLVLAVYAHGTTEGVQSDVQSFSSILARVLFIPVAVL